MRLHAMVLRDRSFDDVYAPLESQWNDCCRRTWPSGFDVVFPGAVVCRCVIDAELAR